MKLTALIRGSVMGIVAVGVLLLSTGIAQAEPAVAGGRFCAASVESQQVECFGTAVEADNAAAGPYLLFQAWDGLDYNGSWIKYWSTTTCTSAYDNEPDKHPDLRNYHGVNANNAISSWQTFYTCRVRFYDSPGYGGDTSLLSHVGVDCRDMRYCFGRENWDDKASSFGLT